MTLSRPRTTRRVLRGSALGLGLLVVGGVTAPAALAVVDPTADPTTEIPVESGTAVALEDVPSDVADEMAPPLEPQFGMGKDFSVHVDVYGPAPADLDLSGAEFVATPVGAADEAPYSCTTDQTGSCTFHVGDLLRAGQGNDAWIPEGDYTLTQVSASAGLQATAGSATFSVCESDAYAVFMAMFGFGEMPEGSLCLDDGIDAAVGNDSLFRTSLVTTVLDQDSQQPVAGAGYTLTTPGYPRRDDLDPTDESDAPDEELPGVDLPTGLPPVLLPPIVLPPLLFPPVVQPPAQETPVEETPETPVPVDESPAPESPAAQVVDLVGDDTTGPADVQYDEQVTDADGELTFGDGETSWFLPGSGYTLTPTTTVPEGYSSDAPYAFALSTTPQQAALRQPLPLVRSLGTGTAGAQQPVPPVAGAGQAPDPGVAAATTSASAPAVASGTSPATGTPTSTSAAALANTGSPVGQLALVGGGLVALGGSAMVAGATLRRRARRSA